MTTPGLCRTHKHAPTFCAEPIYWNKVAKRSLDAYGVKLNAVAHDSCADMYAYVREPSAKKPLPVLDAEPYGPHQALRKPNVRHAVPTQFLRINLCVSRCIGWLCLSPHHPKGETLTKLLGACRKSSAMHSAKRVSARVRPGAPAVRDRAPRLFDVVREHGLRNVTALEAHACKEAESGRTALAEFCTKHGDKLQAYLSAAQSVAAAPAKLPLLGATRMDKLRRVAAEGQCDCGGEWQPGAAKILGANDIPVTKFCEAICAALQLGARRGVNVGCVGAGGCGKSTLLEPLEFIFETLGKPERGSTFPLGNLPVADVILWQDYEHHEETVVFTDLLSVFVGESMELRSPGKLNSKFRNNAPLFYSGRVPLQCSRPRDRAAETVLNGMMAERFHTFKFFKPLPEAERKADWVHCAKCCAEFYLRGAAATDTSATLPAAAAEAAAPAAASAALTLPLATSAALSPATAVATATATAAPAAAAAAPWRKALDAGAAAAAAAAAPAASPHAAAPALTGPAVVAALRDLTSMWTSGALSAEEFAAAKRQLLHLD